MHVIGIIAEYNPFHKGHEYLISRAREEVGDDRAIVMSIMSGPITQRGLPAMIPKHIRARQALMCGSNVVLELPFEWACAPASEFAYGAVKSLMATGVVTDIAFGVEESSAGLVERLADPALYSSDEYSIRLKESLADGDSFPAANAKAIMSLPRISGEDEAEKISAALRSPNTILAIEYLKAMRALGAGFRIHMISRKGQEYSDTSTDTGLDICSASAIRKAIYDTDGTLASVASAVNGRMPDRSAAVMLSALSRREFRLSDPNRYALDAITCSRRDLGSIRFMGDGLDGFVRNVLDDLRTGETSFDMMSSRLATKHFTMPRIYRALTQMILGIHEDGIGPDPRFIRVLGTDRDGRYCLKIMRRCAALPIISNCSDFLEDSSLLKTAELSLRADDLASVTMGIPPGSSRDIPPVIIK
ncbi:Predicted nucleotidyltransferase [Ruminococcaceae bacterium YRB3002]|nr:Predicted nucleotidyltransferase [Ruminococcaceae bacterium YRB3002]